MSEEEGRREKELKEERGRRKRGKRERHREIDSSPSESKQQAKTLQITRNPDQNMLTTKKKKKKKKKSKRRKDTKR